MAGLPIDIKDMIDAFGDIDAARQKPVTVAVLLDATAPEDVQDFARKSFASLEANARVSISYYEGPAAQLPSACDLAVLAAGFSEYTGPLAAHVRASGVPVLVLTTMPEIVKGLADVNLAPLNAKDLIAPALSRDARALTVGDDYWSEPLPLDEAREATMMLAMGNWVVDVFKEKKLAFALCFPFVRKPLALDAVKATSAQNAAVGAVVVLPGADMPVMTANQAKMILQIAAAYGQKMGAERIKELVGVVAGAFALRTAARQVVGVVPGLGWAIKGLIGYSGTWAMGQAAIAYFESLVGEGKPIQEALDAAKSVVEAATGRTTPADLGRRVVQAALKRAGNKD